MVLGLGTKDLKSDPVNARQALFQSSTRPNLRRLDKMLFLKVKDRFRKAQGIHWYSRISNVTAAFLGLSGCQNMERAKHKKGSP